MTSHTYRAFPRTESDSIHVRAIARHLAAQHVGAEGCADFFIMHQKAEEPSIPVNFLKFFEGTEHGGRKVIVIPDSESSVNNTGPNQDSDWLLVLGSGKAIDKLKRFVNRHNPDEMPEIKNLSNFNLENVKDLLQSSLGGELESVGSALKGPLRRHFPGVKYESVDELVNAKTLSAFYYSLAKLLCQVNSNRHDLSKIDQGLFTKIGINDPEDETLQTLGAKQAVAYFLEVTQGLLESLQHFPLGSPSILVIDDDITSDGSLGYGKELLRVITTFLPESKVSIWNPQQESSIRDIILNYQTITQSQIDLNQLRLTVRTLHEDGSSNNPENVFLWNFNIFLVDQLFKPEDDVARSLEFRSDVAGLSGDGEFLGARLIKGLHRILTDRNQLAGKESEFTPVVAISRTDDPSLVLEAYRAGAAEYLPKTQLTRLPALLGNLESRGQSKRSSLHRNFHALHRLSNECIGLMQKARIPRIPYHAQAPEKDKQAGLKIGEKRLRNWSRLLGLLPKADLHVHAGSTMSREFLLYASLVMLARHPWKREANHELSSSTKKNMPVPAEQLAQLVQLFHGVLQSNLESDIEVTFHNKIAFAGKSGVLLKAEGVAAFGKNWIEAWGKKGKSWLKALLREKNRLSPELRGLRASLHRGLKIPDHIDISRACAALDGKDDIKVALHLIRNAQKIKWTNQNKARSEFHLSLTAWTNADLIRTYLLVLGSYYQEAKLSIEDFDFLESIFSSKYYEQERGDEPDPGAYWNKIHSVFYNKSGLPKGQTDVWTASAFVERGWSWPSITFGDQAAPTLELSLKYKRQPPEENQAVAFDDDPIGYTLATGTRSLNLIEYLHGCEFSGAEHLRHPALVHIYACQTIMDWVRSGVFYGELRASPGGYVNEAIDFDFSAVTRCLIRAFSDAQARVLHTFQSNSNDRKSWPADLLGENYSLTTLDKLIATGNSELGKLAGVRSSNEATGDPAIKPQRLPVKASLIFVGKRHKSSREMILEAAGAAALLPGGERPAPAALNFIGQEFSRCRVVGFDLAGPEEGNPPAKHAPEFGRLNRLHLPITVHAGENAGAQFIEDSILELGARRIGHGLSLSEDDRLVARARDDNIVIELCPVCNHQTSQFHDPDESPADARKYPLKKFLKSGVLVTINTDNPIISDTNMVREFYQASYAYDDEGLTLWDALRLIRMGIVSSFLNMRERHHLLEIAEQRIFDYFSEERTIRLLRQLAE